MLEFKKAATYFALFAGATLSGYLLYKANHTQQHTTLTLSHYPDAYMVNAVATVFNPDGKVSMKLVSPRVTHYPNNIINFVTPHITIFSATGSPWQVDADYGQTLNQSNLINFWSHVQIVRAQSAENKPVTILTPVLAYHADKKLAESGESVVFTQTPGNVMHATGFRAHLDTNNVELLANVNGIYNETKDSKQSTIMP